MQEIISIIQSVGFPIFVVIWLLLRSDRKEEATEKAITNATVVMSELKTLIKEKLK